MIKKASQLIPGDIVLLGRKQRLVETAYSHIHTNLTLDGLNYTVPNSTQYLVVGNIEDQRDQAVEGEFHELPRQARPLKKLSAWMFKAKKMAQEVLSYAALSVLQPVYAVA